MVTRIGAISIEKASRISVTLEPGTFIMLNFVMFILTEKKHSDCTGHQHYGSRSYTAGTVLLPHSSHYEVLDKRVVTLMLAV